MKHIIQKTALTLAVTGALVSCGGESGGGGGGTAGIGGSGFVSKGSITNFGSIFVNGVEFETTNATFF